MTEKTSTSLGRVATGVPRPSGLGLPISSALTPKEVWGVLRRHMGLILIMTIVGFLVGGTTWALLRKFLPQYTAQTFIQVLPPVQEDPTEISNQQVHKDIQYGHRISVASRISQQNMFNTLLKQDVVRKTVWFEKEVKGDPTEALRYLLKHFGAYAQREADSVTVSMTCGTARESAAIVNEMARLFVSDYGGQEKEEVRLRLVQLEDRRTQIKTELDQANASLDDVRKTWGIEDVSVDSGAYRYEHPIVTRFNQLQLQESDMLMGIRQMQANIQNLQDLATGAINEQVERAIESDPVMVSLAQQLAIHEASLSGKLSKFGDSHRVVQETRQLLDELKARREARKKEIADQTRQANLKDGQQMLLQMQARLGELQRLREEAEAKKKDLDMARVEFEKRLSVRDERRKMLDTLKEQVEKFKIILNDPKTPNVKWTSLAPEPLEMTATRHWLLWFPAGAMLGFSLSIALAFLMELLDDRMRKPSDVAKYLQIPLLGIIPDDGEENLARDVELSEVVRQAPYSVLSESYRRSRTNLELAGAKSILVTSGGPREGKTCFVSNLGLVVASKDKRVILLDANFRQPGLQAIFPRQSSGDVMPESGFGLSNVLMGQCPYRQAIRPTGAEGLDIMDTGLLPPNPGELLGGARMEALVKELGKTYDLVLIDSPPILLVSDAKVLARAAEYTVVMVNASLTRRGAAQRTLAELKAVRANVLGCILFGAWAIKGGYFREQFKSYRHYLKNQPAA